ncbi:MAG: AIR carboxylase family protein [bacterium]
MEKLKSDKKILVIFDSKNDKDVIKPIKKNLEKNKIDYILRICNPHKTPEILNQVLTDDSKHDYSSIIAGAGIGAHLPGIIASKIIKPIIGLPIHDDYLGLEAFLSIIQMPTGIPVMSVGVNHLDEAIKNAKLMHKQYEYVNLIGDPNSKLVDKARKILEIFGATIKYGEDIDSDAININFVSLDDEIKSHESLVIYCPIDKHKKDIEYPINLLKHAKFGLWVGINNAENAALCAIEILNFDHRYDVMIDKYRKEHSKEIKQQDKINRTQKSFDN